MAFSGLCSARSKKHGALHRLEERHTTPDRVLWSNEKLRLGNLLKTGG